MFPSYLSQRFLAGPTADTAPSSLRKSLVKLNRLTQGEMARIRVGKHFPTISSLRQANIPRDWRTFGPVDAGRPFYPLFKDEVPYSSHLPFPDALPFANTSVSPILTYVATHLVSLRVPALHHDRVLSQPITSSRHLCRSKQRSRSRRRNELRYQQH